jgi:protease PrsW
MINLLILSLSPIIICLAYIYIRDKYEKEPYALLFIGVFFGMFMAVPIAYTQNLLILFLPQKAPLFQNLYLAFIVASFVEELFKFVILFFLIWENDNFNERFDGIVYAVFISLGFAGIENILYVFNPNIGGIATALGRAIFSVPAHALFGVFMGYYFSVSKFKERTSYFQTLSYSTVRMLLVSFLIPWLLHGIYDFILISRFYAYMFFLSLLILIMIAVSLRKITIHLEKSPFK